MYCPKHKSHYMSMKAKYSYHCFTRLTARGCAVAQAVSRRLLTADGRALSQVNPREICGVQSGVGTGCSPSTSVIPCQYHSTNSLYLFIRHRGSINLAVGSTVKLHTHTHTHKPSPYRAVNTLRPGYTNQSVNAV